MFDDTDPTHLSQDTGDSDRPNTSGDDEAGILDDKTPNTEVPGREGSGQDVGESASGVVAGGGDATLFEGGETVELFDGSKEDGDKSGDDEAGQQSGFRTLAPSQGGNRPDDEKEPSTLLHLEPTKAGDDSAADSPPDIEDDLAPDESQTVSRSLDEREIQYPGLRLAYRGRTLCTSPDQSS